MQPKWYDEQSMECLICGVLLENNPVLLAEHEKDPNHKYKLATRPYKEGVEMEEKQVVVRDVMPTFVATLPEMEKRYKELQEFVSKQMVSDEDYGKIPGCPKPTLFNYTQV